MTLKLIDSDEDLSPYAVEIKAAGIDGILGYTRILTKQIVANYHANGLLVGVIDERSATEALMGASAGALRGGAALNYMIELGAPIGKAAIYVTVDDDVVAAQMSTIEDYFAAYDKCIFGQYLIGGYADGTALSGLRQHALPLTWLAGAMGWDGLIFSRTAIRASSKDRRFRLASHANSAALRSPRCRSPTTRISRSSTTAASGR